jgi:hypothetical protein
MDAGRRRPKLARQRIPRAAHDSPQLPLERLGLLAHGVSHGKKPSIPLAWVVRIARGSLRGLKYPVHSRTALPGNGVAKQRRSGPTPRTALRTGRSVRRISPHVVRSLALRLGSVCAWLAGSDSKRSRCVFGFVVCRARRARVHYGAPLDGCSHPHRALLPDTGPLLTWRPHPTLHQQRLERGVAAGACGGSACDDGGAAGGGGMAQRNPRVAHRPGERQHATPVTAGG